MKHQEGEENKDRNTFTLSPSREDSRRLGRLISAKHVHQIKVNGVSKGGGATRAQTASPYLSEAEVAGRSRRCGATKMPVVEKQVGARGVVDVAPYIPVPAL